jgi:beta-glucanase (GH16 family)
MFMIRILTIGLMVLICFAVACKKDSTKSSSGNGLPPGSELEGWKLVWYDEFDEGDMPNLEKWSYEVWDPGRVNDELQAYTYARSENARVVGGILIIEARRDLYQGHEYTSARLVSRTKGDWTYGRFEVRANLPSGRGTWPAIWMMPTNNYYGNKGWPDNGEIDMMEHVGYDPGRVHASIHCNAYNWPSGTNKTATTYVSDAETAYHTYAMEWSADRIDMFVDDTKYFTFENEGTGWEVWPFDKNFYFVLNIAIGGNWGGAQGVDNMIFPTRMEIDYVRVYEKVEE